LPFNKKFKSFENIEIEEVNINIFKKLEKLRRKGLVWYLCMRTLDEDERLFKFTTGCQI
jgi:hypothetical protein